MSIDFQLVNSVASLPINSTGSRKWYECRTTTRLPVGLDKTDTRFFINAMQISRDTFCLIRWVQQIHAWLWYVPISGNGRVTIFVQVNSLAKRLLLDKKDIYAAARKRTVRRLVDNTFQTKALKDQLEKLKDLNSSIEAIALMEAALKASRIAAINLVNPHGELVQVEHSAKKYEFIAKYENNRLLLVQGPSMVKPLDEGHTAYKVRDFISCRPKLLKFHQSNSTHKDRFQNEINFLQNLPKDREYLQDPLEAVLEIPDYGMGYIGEFYSGGSLSSFINKNPTLVDRLKLVRPILNATKQMHEQNIYHGDLKLENIMLVNDGASVKIIDFEEAFNSTNPRGLSDTPLYTPAYIPKKEAARLKELQEECFKENKARKSATRRPTSAMRDLITAKAKHDVFATGTMLFVLLTGEFPYEFDDEGYPKPNADFNSDALSNLNIDPSIIDLLSRMTDQNPAKRISSQEAHGTGLYQIKWEEILKSHEEAVSVEADVSAAAS